MSVYRQAERMRLRQGQQRKKGSKSSSLTASLTALFTRGGSKDDCSRVDYSDAYFQTQNDEHESVARVEYVTVRGCCVNDSSDDSTDEDDKDDNHDEYPVTTTRTKGRAQMAVTLGECV